ncbi:MAG: site-specific DNA-methyltransferase [Desulfuromonadaceae bacterium]|nr:site-specific DNA-methyltransferase [Desulfuromonadaceae bacterium]
MDSLKMQSPNLVDANIEKIAALFPNCITEDRDENGTVRRVVDFDLLRQELSASLVEGPRERYTLNWPGKNEAILTANAPIAKTLRPCKEESVDFENTRNIYIEGDNLDALKLLQETYLNKIKMIYIDPPYNTGNDFIYEDDFAEDVGSYFERSKQFDIEGNRLIANTEANGRFHSDWLSMVFSRLKLARNLLSEDGVIFISINDIEITNLRKACDEIFGEGNLIADLIWQNKEGGGGSDSSYFRIKHEHIVVYAKQIECVDVIGTPVTNMERYTSSDEYKSERGPYYLQKLNKASIQYSQSLDYAITDPDGNDVFPAQGTKRACWRWSKPKVEWGIANGFIEFKKDRDNHWQVYTKQYLYADNNGNRITRLNPPSGVIDDYSTTNASKKMEALLGASIFNYSKPVELIQYLMNRVISSEKGGIVLDFFSGSATTAHAVMQQNSDDNGNRNFIMVQLPEACEEKSEACKAGYKTIAEIGKERIRRAGKKIKEANPLTTKNLDIGFRVFKIDNSNMKDVYYTPDELKQDNLELFKDHIKPDRSPEDLLFQVFIDWGLDLTLPIAKETIDGKAVYFVDSNALIACFDSGITEELVKKLAAHKPLRVVFRDDAFGSDSVKINVEQIFKLLSPVTEVKSI